MRADLHSEMRNQEPPGMDKTHQAENEAGHTQTRVKLQGVHGHSVPGGVCLLIKMRSGSVLPYHNKLPSINNNTTFNLVIVL